LPLYCSTQGFPVASLPSWPLDKRERYRWDRLWSARTLAVVLPLFAWWVLWNWWTTHHFAGNASAAAPRLLLNLGILLWPVAWPQLAGALAFLWPFTFLWRHSIPDAVIRSWAWLPVMWLVLMLRYGLLIETRIFGELVPYFACTTVLIAEELLLRRVASPKIELPAVRVVFKRPGRARR
jgi:hypothetical protein